MGDSDTLKISPKYNANQWRDLKPDEPDAWVTAATVVEDRLKGRFLDYATAALKSPFQASWYFQSTASSLRQLRNFA